MISPLYLVQKHWYQTDNQEIWATHKCANHIYRYEPPIYTYIGHLYIYIFLKPN
jgi:hypothetical protein